MAFGKLPFRFFLLLQDELYYEIRNFKIKIVLQQPTVKPGAKNRVISDTKGRF
jgi:hypothetical protein